MDATRGNAASACCYSFTLLANTQSRATAILGLVPALPIPVTTLVMGVRCSRNTPDGVDPLVLASPIPSHDMHATLPYQRSSSSSCSCPCPTPAVQPFDMCSATPAGLLAAWARFRRQDAASLEFSTAMPLPPCPAVIWTQYRCQASYSEVTRYAHRALHTPPSFCREDVLSAADLSCRNVQFSAISS